MGRFRVLCDVFFFVQAEDGIRIAQESRGLGDVYKRPTPTWRILIYSNGNPPQNRGIVLIDGVNGEIVEWFAEENPERWDPQPGA